MFANKADTVRIQLFLNLRKANKAVAICFITDCISAHFELLAMFMYTLMAP